MKTESSAVAASRGSQQSSGQAQPSRSPDRAVQLQDPSPFLLTVNGRRESPPRRHSIQASNTFLDSILNPPDSIEPRQTHESLGHLPHGSIAETPSYRYLACSPETEPPLETDAQVAFLLRHFSEGPGQWYELSSILRISECLKFLRMDLYDAGSYFSVDVPIQSLSSPLLKAAVCAYAAKHVSRISMNAKADPTLLSPATTKWPEKDHVDWAVLGAQYYTTAINLLREELNEPQRMSTSMETGPGERGAWKIPRPNDFR